MMNTLIDASETGNDDERKKKADETTTDASKLRSDPLYCIFSSKAVIFALEGCLDAIFEYYKCVRCGMNSEYERKVLEKKREVLEFAIKQDLRVDDLR